MQILQPAGWPRPKGYANGVMAEGKLVFTGGLVGWDETETFHSDDLVEQTRRLLLNIVAVLKEAGARPEHIVRMTWYVLDKQEYLQAAGEIGRVYQEVIGRHYPAMALLQVSGLLEDRARVEIETTAVIPRQE